MKKPSAGKKPKSKKAERPLKGSPGNTASRGRRSGKSGDVTLKQRKYVRGRIAGKTKKAAALEAGYAETTAKHAKEKIDEKPAVKALFKDVLELAGVSDEVLAERIREGLEANTVVRETLYAKREVLVDFSERREMVELVAKLKGHLVEKHEVRDKTLEDLLEGSYE